MISMKSCLVFVLVTVSPGIFAVDLCDLVVDRTEGAAPLTVSFDVSCPGIFGGVSSYDWDFDDGKFDEGTSVENTFELPGNYAVLLTVTDNSGGEYMFTTDITVLNVLESFSDEFDRPDGPVDGWAPSVGNWNIEDERLTTLTGPVNGQRNTEHWVWAGEPAALFGDVVEISFTFEFLRKAADSIGRHGGVMFAADTPTRRQFNRGYTIEWIDRESDRGISLKRWFGASAGDPLVLGSPDIEEPPLHWRILLLPAKILFFGDGELLFEVTDSKYRGGHFGFWAFEQSTAAGGQEIAVDNVRVGALETFVGACFENDKTISTSLRPLLMPIDTPVEFDASCSDDNSTLPITTFAWDLGDGDTDSGALVTHSFDTPGPSTVTLTVEDDLGDTATASQTFEVVETSVGYSDEFARSNGPAFGWTVGQGDWRVTSNTLTHRNDGPTESWIYAGAPAVAFSDVQEFEFTLEFLSQAAHPLGRHAGCLLFSQDVSSRMQFRGYSIDWIDRCGDLGCDQGYRIARWTGGSEVNLFLSDGEVTDPGEEWRIEVDGATIRFVVDDETIAEVEDDTYRTGHFGFWAFNNGTEMDIDNVSIGSPPDIQPCFVLPDVVDVELGRAMTLDASCSSASAGIDAYRWDFGDETTGSGEVVEHTFTETGVVTVTLTVEARGGATAQVSHTLEVFGPTPEFSDSFDGPAGSPAGWTLTSGDWEVLDGRLTTKTAAGTSESWIYAGDPAIFFRGTTVLEFDVEFLNQPEDGVGRHGGVLLFGSGTQPRQGNSGYTISWIDRESDRGYHFIRWQGGVASGPIIVGADKTDPAPHWRVEIRDEFIEFKVSDSAEDAGETLLSIEDDTYRKGHFGLWTFNNGTQASFDNVSIRREEVVLSVFLRGDHDASGKVDFSDAISLLTNLLVNSELFPVTCANASDADNSGVVDFTDAISILRWSLLNTFPLELTLPGPFECGPDPTFEIDPAGDGRLPPQPVVDLGCESYTVCPGAGP